MTAVAEVRFIAYFILIGTVYVAASGKDQFTAGDVLALLAVTYVIRRGID